MSSIIGYLGLSGVSDKQDFPQIFTDSSNAIPFLSSYLSVHTIFDPLIIFNNL